MNRIVTCLLLAGLLPSQNIVAATAGGEYQSPLTPSGKWTAFTRGNAATPPMGWNSWNAFRTDVDEQKVMGAARAIVDSGLMDKGYRYINIDDGWWLKRRTEDERLIIRTSIFPSADMGNGKDTSFRPFVDRLHSMGLKAGIYSEVGKNACSQVWDLHSPNLPEGTTEEREVGLWGHVSKDIALFFEEWGFDYVKVDACGLADYAGTKPFIREYNYNAFEPMIIRGNLEATDVVGVENLYKNVADALIDSNSDNDFILSICTWGTANVRGWGKDQGNLWRTSEDIRDSWESMLHVFDSASTRALFAGPGTWNDPDMLFIGHGDFDEGHLIEAKSHFSLWAIIAAPLIIGYDLRDAPDSLIQIWGNEEVIAVNQDSAGNQGVLVHDSASTQVLVKSLSDKVSKAVAMFNRTDTKQRITLQASTLAFTDSDEINLSNLWDKNDKQSFKSAKTFTLEPHQTLIFKATGKRILGRGQYLSEMPGAINVAVDGVSQLGLSPDEHRELTRSSTGNVETSGYRQHYPGFGGPRVSNTPYGKRIILNSKPFIHGIGALANSRMEVKLNKAFSEFSTFVGIDDSSVDKKTEVVFHIYGDGRKLMSSAPVSYGEKPLRLNVNVSDVSILELVSETKGKPEKPAIIAWAESVLE